MQAYFIRIAMIAGIACATCATSAFADCSALNICGKTIIAKTKYGTMSVYVAADDNVFTTDRGGTITNRVGANHVGTHCTATGATQTISCPGPNCTNTYRGPKTDSYTQTQTTSCKVTFDGNGFVLQQHITIQSEQNMFMAGQQQHQSTSQDLTAEGRITVSQGSCSVNWTSTNNMATSNTWTPPSSQTINDSYASTSCSVVSGRRL